MESQNASVANGKRNATARELKSSGGGARLRLQVGSPGGERYEKDDVRDLGSGIGDCCFSRFGFGSGGCALCREEAYDGHLHHEGTDCKDQRNRTIAGRGGRE